VIIPPPQDEPPESPSERYVHHIFLDDNVERDRAHIVDVRDLVTGDPLPFSVTKDRCGLFPVCDCCMVCYLAVSKEGSDPLCTRYLMSQTCGLVAPMEDLCVNELIMNLS
jgi:hypothetical protein